jgi:hypothetical protein
VVLKLDLRAVDSFTGADSEYRNETKPAPRSASAGFSTAGGAISIKRDADEGQVHGHLRSMFDWRSSALKASDAFNPWSAGDI